MGYNPETEIDKHIKDAIENVKEAIEKLQKVLADDGISEYKEFFVEKIEKALTNLYSIKRNLKND